MTVKLLDGGRYKVDIRPRGATGRRIQRILKKADAVAFEKYVISNMHDKDWLDKPTDHRRLSELLDRWWSCTAEAISTVRSASANLSGN